jgi:hypothetical protein
MWWALSAIKSPLPAAPALESRSPRTGILAWPRDCICGAEQRQVVAEAILFAGVEDQPQAFTRERRGYLMIDPSLQLGIQIEDFVAGRWSELGSGKEITQMESVR